MEMFEKGGAAMMVFEYKGPDTNNQKKVVPKSGLRKPAGEPLTVDPYAGIKEEHFYFGQGQKLSNLNSRKVDKSRVVSFINYPSTGGQWSGFDRKDDFAA